MDETLLQQMDDRTREQLHWLDTYYRGRVALLLRGLGFRVRWELRPAWVPEDFGEIDMAAVGLRFREAQGEEPPEHARAEMDEAGFTRNTDAILAMIDEKAEADANRIVAESVAERGSGEVAP